MSIETPNRCKPKMNIERLRGLSVRVAEMRQRGMGVAMICEELELPRDMVLMLSRFS